MSNDNENLGAADLCEKILELLRTKTDFNDPHREVVVLKTVAMALVISIGKVLKIPALELSKKITEYHADDLLLHTGFALLGSKTSCPIEEWNGILSTIVTDLMMCPMADGDDDETTLSEVTKTVVQATFCIVAFANKIPAKLCAKIAVANSDSIVEQIKRLIHEAKAVQASQN